MRSEFLIAYSSFGSVLIPLTIAMTRWRKTWDHLKPICLILILSLTSDLLSYILIQVGIDTYVFVNIYLIVQFILIAWLFRNHLPDQTIVDIIIILFLLFSLVNLTLIQGPWILNTVSSVVASLIVIAFSLYFFYRLLNDLPIVHVQHLPMFWISFGVLTYYAGNFFLFLAKNYLTPGETGRLMWILHNLLNITKNLLFAIALWQSYRKLKSSTLSA